MKNILFWIFIYIAVLACDSRNNKKHTLTTDTALSKANPSPQLLSDSSRDVKKSKDTQQIVSAIFGIWAITGDENATFVITKDKITYPDQNASYNYVFKNDSLHIKFDGYDGNYLLKSRGPDTIVLIGDEKQVYHRFKKY
jgi:hypothetical protein